MLKGHRTCSPQLISRTVIWFIANSRSTKMATNKRLQFEARTVQTFTTLSHILTLHLACSLPEGGEACPHDQSDSSPNPSARPLTLGISSPPFVVNVAPDKVIYLRHSSHCVYSIPSPFLEVWRAPQNTQGR